MVVQYVFFRDPTGKAAKDEDGKYAPTHLLAELGKLAILQKDGNIGGWRGLWQPRIALFSRFLIQNPEGGELNPDDVEEILWKTMEDVAKRAGGKPLNAIEVLKSANSHAAQFFQRPPKSYVLVTSLSIKAFPTKEIAIGGCKITPLAKREPRYPMPKVLHSSQHCNFFSDNLKNSSYQLVKVACSGRSIHEAVENALKGLNLLRAIWSHSVTNKSSYPLRLVSGPRKPIGVIHTGAVHTLHNPDGSAVNDLYWFDPDYIRDQELFGDNVKWPELEKSRQRAMRKLASLPYKSDMEEILLRYIAALDQANPNVAFLQLWGILEKITDTVGAKYDETIKRICWLFAGSCRKVMKEALESLRQRRNRFVHAGKASNDSEETTQLIKSFVDPHIVCLLNNKFRVKSLQEYGEFLSYPTDTEQLKKMRTWTSRALSAAREDNKEELKSKSRSE